MPSHPEDFTHLPSVDEEAVEKPPPTPASEPSAAGEAGGGSLSKEVSHKRMLVQGRESPRVSFRSRSSQPEPAAAAASDAPPASPPKNKATQRMPASADVPSPPPQTPHRAPSLPPLKSVVRRSPRALVTVADAPPQSSWRQRWEKWGGRSLALSIGVHALLLIAAALIVVHQVMDRQIDFLPGGGSVQGAQAEQALQHKIQQKKNPWLKQSVPIRKIAVNGMSNLSLPADVPDMLDFSPSSKPLGGSPGGGGFGLAGAGGGFGKGVGLGAQNGMTFGPLFGLNIKARKLAVVLDVSSSMTPHLERVVREVDKVAKGSVVVLYFGCGLEEPKKPLVGTRVFRTSAIEFEKFWRMGGATYMETAAYKIDPKKPIPMKDLFLQLSRRPQTYFVHNVGVGFTWLALLSDEVRNADGLYWFSDFQDKVDFKQVEIVLEGLKRRKQRLYIHSYGKGQYFDLIKNQLVIPTEGDSYAEE